MVWCGVLYELIKLASCGVSLVEDECLMRWMVMPVGDRCCIRRGAHGRCWGKL